MKLTYRTINYERQQPCLDIVEGELGGKYRGNAWQVHYPRHIPVPLDNPTLKYRGVAYQPKCVVVSPQSQPQVSAQTIPEATPENVATVHTANICRMLEHRRQVAEARGDQQLLKILDLEAQQLACSYIEKCGA